MLFISEFYIFLLNNTDFFKKQALKFKYQPSHLKVKPSGTVATLPPKIITILVTIILYLTN
jgi:hypothetical protein